MTISAASCFAALIHFTRFMLFCDICAKSIRKYDGNPPERRGVV